MDKFTCPNCKHEYIVSDLEIWELYEEGAETEFDCEKCDAEILIVSAIDKWKFTTEKVGDNSC